MNILDKFLQMARSENIVDRLQKEIRDANHRVLKISMEIQDLDFEIEMGDGSDDGRRTALLDQLKEAQIQVQRKSNALERAKVEFAAEENRKRELQEKAKWEAVENNFIEMAKLSDEIDAALETACKKYDDLFKLSHESFDSIPKKDVRIWNDSPIGQAKILGSFQLQLRKHGHRWAALWLDDPRKIPTLRSTVENAKGWALKMRPNT